MAQQVSTNTFGIAKWIVSADATQGTHTTIAGALTSASSGDTIYIRDGSYTENLTLKAGVNLAAMPGAANPANVTVTGKMSASFSGSCSVSNIKFITNSDFNLTLTGANATVVVCYGCNFSGTNNTIFNSTGSNAAASIVLENCVGDLGTTGIKLINSTNGQHTFYFSQFTNTGASLTASTITAGILGLNECVINTNFTTSTTGIINTTYSTFDNSANNLTCLTIGGGTSNSLCCKYLSGTASAISVGATWNSNWDVISSSNTNAVTGAGTIAYSPLAFIGSSSTVNTSTQSPANIGPKIYATGGISFDSGTTTLSTYTEGTFTPTLVGASVTGTTTYTVQQGYYRRIGNLVTAQFNVQGTAATGTGNALFGALPFTVKNQTGGAAQGAVLSASAGGWVYVVSTTMLTMDALINTTTANIYCSGTATVGGLLQMANAAFNFQTTISYEV